VVRENGGADQRHDHWRLRKEGEQRWTHTPVHGPLSSNSGELVRDWCIAGHGIMLRSLWDVAPQIERGELIRVLPPWSMPEADVHWIAPYRAQVARRIRLLVDFLTERFQDEPWRHRSARAVSVPAAPPGSRRKR
jgi:DNA-binding transcriptional LysR family regulator